MRCLFVFRDASGWLPTAQDLLHCGFQVSEAALPPARHSAQPTRQGPGAQGGLALAAEPHCAYGAEPQARYGAEPQRSYNDVGPQPRGHAEPEGPHNQEQPALSLGQHLPRPGPEQRPAKPATAATREDGA